MAEEGDQPEVQKAGGSDALFPDHWGYGGPITSKYCVLSFTGELVPLYFVYLDTQRLKVRLLDLGRQHKP